MDVAEVRGVGCERRITGFVENGLELGVEPHRRELPLLRTHLFEPAERAQIGARSLCVFGCDGVAHHFQLDTEQRQPPCIQAVGAAIQVLGERPLQPGGGDAGEVLQRLELLIQVGIQRVQNGGDVSLYGQRIAGGDGTLRLIEVLPLTADVLLRLLDVNELRRPARSPDLRLAEQLGIGVQLQTRFQVAHVERAVHHQVQQRRRRAVV